MDDIVALCGEHWDQTHAAERQRIAAQQPLKTRRFRLESRSIPNRFPSRKLAHRGP
jgi:hypothetical protein